MEAFKPTSKYIFFPAVSTNKMWTSEISVGLDFKVFWYRFILTNFIYLVICYKLGLGHPCISLKLKQRNRLRSSLGR